MGLELSVSDEAWIGVVFRATDAKAIAGIEVVQTLWSGYGEILKVSLDGGALSDVVVKCVRLPDDAKHPRGWNTDLSHQRKLKSYAVEAAWYRDWSSRCGDVCRVPECFGLEEGDSGWVMVMEDLDASGFPLRKGMLGKAGVKVCLTWLANFHATFLQESPDGLWDEGTYWHLATRPDEFSAMPDSPLKASATYLDERLRCAQFKTLVHGDAKVANFCFSNDGEEVAAVDFQYVGGGCGIRDVAYLLGSCLTERQCEGWEVELLDHYFNELTLSLARHGKAQSADAIEEEWRVLYPIAWTDFYRFLEGWMPSHSKINSYTRKLAEKVLANTEGVPRQSSLK